MSSDSENEIEVNNLDDETIVNKYKMSAEMVQKILKELISKCKSGVSVLELCNYGDKRIAEECSQIFKKDKEIKKGISFPTCIMRNNIVCNLSPLSNSTPELLEDGDLIKINMGAHVDGYAAVVGHSFVIGASKDNKIIDRRADAIVAANNCVEALMRLIKPGRNSKDIEEYVSKIASDYKCKMLDNCVAYNFLKDVYETAKTFSINPPEEARKTAEKVDFEVNQVWSVDVIISTGEGKVKERELKPTMYKRNIAADIYNLKLKASRQFFSEVCNNHLSYPFTLRNFTDATKAKIAVIECAKHELVDPLPVMYEKDGEFIVQFRYTVLLLPNGPMKLTGLPFDTSSYKSENKVTDAKVKSLLSEPIKNKKKPVVPSGEQNQ